MHDMATKLEKAAEAFHVPDREGEPPTLPKEAEAMRDSAILWSKMCLQEFRDDLLRKGLMVSAAIADFLAELETNTPMVR